MHQVHIGRSPAYLADMMTATADLPSRERTPFRQQFPIRNPKTETQVLVRRAFSYAGPNAWNSLPSNLQEQMKH